MKDFQLVEGGGGKLCRVQDLLLYRQYVPTPQFTRSFLAPAFEGGKKNI